MAHISRHNADTNEGVLASDYEMNRSIKWHGDFAECAKIAKLVKPLEKAAYLAGLNVAATAIDKARLNTNEKP